MRIAGNQGLACWVGYQIKLLEDEGADQCVSPTRLDDGGEDARTALDLHEDVTHAPLLVLTPAGEPNGDPTRVGEPEHRHHGLRQNEPGGPGINHSREPSTTDLTLGDQSRFRPDDV